MIAQIDEVVAQVDAVVTFILALLICFVIAKDWVDFYSKRTNSTLFWAIFMTAIGGLALLRYIISFV